MVPFVMSESSRRTYPLSLVRGYMEPSQPIRLQVHLAFLSCVRPEGNPTHPIPGACLYRCRRDCLTRRCPLAPSSRSCPILRPYASIVLSCGRLRYRVAVLVHMGQVPGVLREVMAA